MFIIMLYVSSSKTCTGSIFVYYSVYFSPKDLKISWDVCHNFVLYTEMFDFFKRNAYFNPQSLSFCGYTVLIFMYFGYRWSQCVSSKAPDGQSHSAEALLCQWLLFPLWSCCLLDGKWMDSAEKNLFKNSISFKLLYYSKVMAVLAFSNTSLNMRISA